MCRQPERTFPCVSRLKSSKILGCARAHGTPISLTSYTITPCKVQVIPSIKKRIAKDTRQFVVARRNHYHSRLFVIIITVIIIIAITFSSAHHSRPAAINRERKTAQENEVGRALFWCTSSIFSHRGVINHLSVTQFHLNSGELRVLLASILIRAIGTRNGDIFVWHQNSRSLALIRKRSFAICALARARVIVGAKRSKKPLSCSA